MRAIQELQVELPAPPDGRSGVSGRLRQLVSILVGVLGGLFCAIVLSTLLAHPVGAAVDPGAEGALPIAAIHDALPPAVPTGSAATTGAADAIVKPVVTAVIPQVTLALRTGMSTLRPVAQTLTAVVLPPLASLVPVVTSAGGPRSPKNLAPTPLPVRRRGAQVFVPQAKSFPRNVPLAPLSPNRPTTPVPFLPSGTTGSGSSSVPGNSLLAGHPPLDLPLPTTLSARLVLGLSRDSGILLDLRHSPPG